ncbi:MULTISPECIES: hypothetical protein [unclassified Novosphingobium]|uniref:hypothetical protein n=1 Tax=unclassified Novosphingobium TaxID=2644732 RepID=UPI000868B5AC|nr:MULTISPECIES: hypothetical protein [unclassified Novosphingobium]MBN9143730.1 hypothetical protein [Novosphingobium sp.]ODU84342.1 MAG: hypothetical protein ABT10_02870 [Novosphingobium sp. SCN 63-17]OJX92882.1 MAG: hypothetical protein BGP00_23470 [Novosphingobium sp. 63-713]
MNRRQLHTLPMAFGFRHGSGQRAPLVPAPLAPSFRANAPLPVARGGVRRGLPTSPADCAINHSTSRSKSRPPFLRLLPIAALVIGLLQSAAAFTVLLTAPAGGAGLSRHGERAQAIIREPKLHGASALPFAHASCAGHGGMSMPAMAEPLRLGGAGTISGRGIPA